MNAKVFHVTMMAVGAAVLGWLIYDTGVGVLWRDMQTFGWGLAAFVALEGVADVFHAIATMYCFSRSQRVTPFWMLWCIRISGAAINYLTPTASIGGEVTKVGLLERYVTRTEAASAIVIDKLSWTVAQLGTAGIGTAVLLWWIPMDRRVVIALFVTSVLVGAGCAGFLFFQVKGWFGPAIRKVFGERAHGWMTRQLGDVDTLMVRYYREQPWDLAHSIFWHVLGFACGVVQAYLFLWWLGVDASWLHACAIWMVATLIDIAAFAVPAGVGTQEGGRVLVFVMLGHARNLGLSFGLALRIEQILFAVLGLLLYPLLLRRKPLQPAAALDAPPPAS